VLSPLRRSPSCSVSVPTSAEIESWQQRMFRKARCIWAFSIRAYRVSRSKVVVLGLAARGLARGRRLEWCQWHGRGASAIAGRLAVQLDARHNHVYQTAVLTCQAGTAPLHVEGGHMGPGLKRRTDAPVQGGAWACGACPGVSRVSRIFLDFGPTVLQILVDGRPARALPKCLRWQHG